MLRVHRGINRTSADGSIRGAVVAREPGGMTIIEVSHLAKSYGSVRAVSDVSFTVERGEIFGVLGPNGAGKSTTVECIAGLRQRDAGRIRVLDVDPGVDRPAVQAQVGIQLQHSELPDQLRVGEALDLYASFYPDPADPRELLDVLGLAGKARSAWKTLSGGQKQRVSIALALVGNPVVAILDELTTGLDPAARRETWDLVETVRDRGVTIVLVTHFMQEAEHLCDRLAVIDGGRVVALDTPAGLVARVDAGQHMRFRPSAPVEDRLLEGLADVRTISRVGDQLVLTGTADLVASVTSLLARLGVVAHELRVEQASLDDAFVAMTRAGGGTAASIQDGELA
jgi:ABC-2 type transport system ATP-binding protein